MWFKCCCSNACMGTNRSSNSWDRQRCWWLAKWILGASGSLCCPSTDSEYFSVDTGRDSAYLSQSAATACNVYRSNIANNNTIRTVCTLPQPMHCTRANLYGASRRVCPLLVAESRRRRCYVMRSIEVTVERGGEEILYSNGLFPIPLSIEQQWSSTLDANQFTIIGIALHWEYTNFTIGKRIMSRLHLD